MHRWSLDLSSAFPDSNHAHHSNLHHLRDRGACDRLRLVGHCGIVVGIVFLMVMRGYRPHFRSIWRTFAWSEVYFVVTIAVDLITGVNYGYLLHKPQAASLLSFLSDNWPVYLLQMHLLALAFFFALYAPFAVYDLFMRSRKDA